MRNILGRTGRKFGFFLALILSCEILIKASGFKQCKDSPFCTKLRPHQSTFLVVEKLATTEPGTFEFLLSDRIDSSESLFKFGLHVFENGQIDVYCHDVVEIASRRRYQLPFGDFLPQFNAIKNNLCHQSENFSSEKISCTLQSDISLDILVNRSPFFVQVNKNHIPFVKINSKAKLFIDKFEDNSCNCISLSFS
jgi:hypothetical protein